MKLVEEETFLKIVKHFAALRTEYRSLKGQDQKLENEVNDLSYELIPTMFQHQNVKTIKIDNVEKSPSISAG